MGTVSYPLTMPEEPPEGLPEGEMGRFMEGLDDRLKSALRVLVANFKDDTLSARREEVKKSKQAREYWKGVQNIWWNESDQEWRFPFDQIASGDLLSDQQPRYSFITNIYQAFGLSIMSVLSQSVPNTRLFPQSTQQPEDVTTAKVGTEVIRLIQRNNNATHLLEKIAYYAWIDGKVAGYMRYVQDGLRFGYKDNPQMDLGQFQMPGEEAMMECPGCGSVTPLSQFEGICPGCGAPLDESSLRPPMSYDVPQQTGMDRIEKGQEVLDVFGALEVRTPMWANHQHEFPYLFYTTEVHRSKLQFTYPHVRDKLSEETPSGGEDTYERQVRLRLHYSGIYDEAGTPSANLITFDRVWLRPWVFEAEMDQGVRTELLQLFPEGVYVAFAADTFCEARPENLDDHWTVMQIMPGEGQNRNGIGTPMVSIQERYNTLNNLVVENIEFGVPPIYADDAVLDFDALEDQTAEPGAHYPVTPPTSGRVSDAFFQPQPTPISSETYRYIQDLAGPMGQFQVGAFPSLFGGSASNIDTMGAYAMSRDQAIGRQGIFYRGIKTFWDSCMIKGVMVYRNNRDDDLEVPLKQIGQEYPSGMIRLDELQGSVVVYAETEEQFPETWPAKRRTLMELMQLDNEELKGVMTHPDNMKILKDLLGLDTLTIPGEDSRDKQWREIARLLEEQPVQTPQGFLSSIEIDVFDDHEVELEVLVGWINSSVGQQAKEQNPMGYMNLRAHATQHQEALAMMEQQQMQQELALTAAMSEAENAGKPQPQAKPAAKPASKKATKEKK